MIWSVNMQLFVAYTLTLSNNYFFRNMRVDLGQNHPLNRFVFGIEICSALCLYIMLWISIHSPPKALIRSAPPPPPPVMFIYTHISDWFEVNVNCASLHILVWCLEVVVPCTRIWSMCIGNFIVHRLRSCCK